MAAALFPTGRLRGSGWAGACLAEGELERVQAPCQLAALLAPVERGKDGGCVGVAERELLTAPAPATATAT